MLPPPASLPLKDHFSETSGNGALHDPSVLELSNASLSYRTKFVLYVPFPLITDFRTCNLVGHQKKPCSGSASHDSM